MRKDFSRRRFSAWLMASPIAISLAGRAGAAWNNVETPPVFQRIDKAEFTPLPSRANLFTSQNVRLAESPFLQAQRWNSGYLKRLDADRLLHSFRLTAGLPSSAKPLGGWEAPDCELRGHFTGHYLSACALAWSATGDQDTLARGNLMVAQLANCQQAMKKDGYLSAFPVSLFDRLAAGAEVWAPFYTYHKILNGMLDMHEMADSTQALDVAVRMARWADHWTAERGEQGMQTVLEVEFGGMNDALYRLATATGDSHWITVGDRFTKKRVFEPLAARKDQLRGLHMNTHVPQVIGAARRHEMTGDPRFGDVASFFWETVTGTRTYATGGASNNEHWLTEPNHLAKEWESGHDHQEYCCSYNMLKLGTHLFTQTPNAAIADYYERNLINHRLGTIQPETGLTTYFLSMAPAAWKTWGTDDSTFWCCNGSALEDFSTFNRMIYARDDKGIWVNLFIASDLDWAAHGVRLRQATSFPAEPRTLIMIEASDHLPWTMRLRMPSWLAEGGQVRVNGKALDGLGSPGSYLEIRRRWQAGDRVEMVMPMQTRWEVFPDRPDVGALVHGPVVLAQHLPLGTIPSDLMHEHGPKVDKVAAPVAPVPLPRDVVRQLVPVQGQPLHFTAAIEGQSVDLRPVNACWERYSVYNSIV